MSVFATLYERVIEWSRHRHAPKYLAGVSFAEASFFPIPVAVMLLPMTLAQPKRAFRLAALTTLFSVLGGILGYLIGLWLFEAVAPYFASHSAQIDQARAWFDEYGVWVVLMAGFSPVPYKIFTITAGSMAMALLPFILASIVGRASQFYLIAALVNWFGPAMESKIRQYIEWIGWVVVVIIVALLLYFNFAGQG